MGEKYFDNYVSSNQRIEHTENRLEKVNSKKSHKCIFCQALESEGFKKATFPKIIDIPNTNVLVVANFDKSFIVVNKYPYAIMGHVMVVPHRHVGEMSDLNSEEIDEIFKFVMPKLISAIKKEYSYVSGINIGMNMGKGAGASEDHLHIHVVPRFPNENGFMEVTSNTRVPGETPEMTMKRIGKHFK